MIGLLFTIIISIGIPLVALVYAFYKKRHIPFVWGVIAFVISQVILRIPLMQFLAENSVAYSMFQATQPILFAIIIGLSAGVFEELARYLIMRFLLKQKDWLSGLLFGAGHGGVEAILFVGISAVSLILSPTSTIAGDLYFIGGIERFFAMLMHIGLSIIVLQGVVKKKFVYIVSAIFIHGLIDALVGIIPLYVPGIYGIIVLEVVVAITALALLMYSIRLKKGRVLQ